MTRSGTWQLHRRSIKIALLVGTLLAAINYGDKILTGSMLATDWIKLILTYFVPYAVATYSAWSTLKTK
ncbi:hypothetical protein SAMN02745866_00036 [Alteromonadaceae bacterium Bs31]|nr:hypothetical protein SAMN02745866_00036 [Alteromonadaceae bacterium Bs31]